LRRRTLQLFRQARLVFGVLAAALTFALACDDEAERPRPATPTTAVSPAPVTGNLLVNPDFEERDRAWTSAAGHVAFTVAADPARGGSSSAYLRLEGGPEETGTRIVSAVQVVETAHVPDVLRGSVYIDNWQRGTPVQYVQAVFMPLDAPVDLPGLQSLPQLRYVLAGVDEEPFAIANARFVFVGLDDATGDPQSGRWLQFELHLRDDYARLWNLVPDGGTQYRLLLEARWDGKAAGSGTPRADVYFDDVYLGSE
jgi:hypothetical protein